MAFMPEEPHSSDHGSSIFNHASVSRPGHTPGVYNPVPIPSVEPGSGGVLAGRLKPSPGIGRAVEAARSGMNRASIRRMSRGANPANAAMNVEAARVDLSH